MNIYPVLVFLHVLGGVGIFIALAIEAVGLSRLRRAGTPAEARIGMEMLGLVRRLGPVAMLTLLVTGIWMMARWWGPRPWIQAAAVASGVAASLGLGTQRPSVVAPHEGVRP
jgi:hypothetical protein